jgi:hypothetical protein
VEFVERGDPTLTAAVTSVDRDGTTGAGEAP